MSPLLSVGEVAFLLGVPRRRVQWWIERGYMEVVPDHPGKGHNFRISQDELSVALRAVEIQKNFGVLASKTLFAKMRQEHADKAEPDPSSPSCPG